MNLETDLHSVARNPETGSVRDKLTPVSTVVNLPGMEDQKSLHDSKSNICEFPTLLRNSRNPKSLSVCQRMRRLLHSHLLLTLTVGGVILGFVIGFSIRTANPSKAVLTGIGFPGDIFLRLLKMTIIPLIVSSTIAGTATLDPKSNGKIGAISVGYLSFINLLGSLLGLALGLAIKPGHGIQGVHMESKTVSSLKTEDVMMDMLRNMFPDNLVRATLQKVQTEYISGEVPSVSNASLELNASSAVDAIQSVGYTDSSNILGLIFGCVVFGVAAGISGEKGRPFVDFFESAASIIIVILGWFLWLAPVGIGSLIAASIGGIDDLVGVFTKLALLVAAVVSGIAMQQLLILPLIHVVITRQNPYKILMQMPKAWLLGFASAGSACAMPEMYKICEKNKIDKRVSSFTIPLSVTLNANGSALFICVASLFLAQIAQISLDAGQIATIGVLTTVSAMALPSVPSASIVTLVMILSTLGLPPENLGLLFAVEWFLDRMRTTSSVVGDVMCVYLVQHLCQQDLDAADQKRRNKNPYTPTLEPTVEEEGQEDNMDLPLDNVTIPLTSVTQI